MASSSIVIKVKNGYTLRRFSASVVDNKLSLDIVMLKDKICSLFSFGSDVEFAMTYVDEDGDVVTLVDDDDLRDAVRQSLNPLRIVVNGRASYATLPHLPFTANRARRQRVVHDSAVPYNQTFNSGVSGIARPNVEPHVPTFAQHLGPPSSSVNARIQEAPNGGASSVNGESSAFRYAN